MYFPRGFILSAQEKIRVLTTRITKLRLTIGAAVVAALALSACQETTPVEGPRGPAGPAGNTAIEVRTFTIRSSHFSTGRITVATALYPMPELAQAVVDGGIVTGYWDLGSGDDRWWQLPDVFQFSDGIVTTVNFIYSVGSVGLQVTGPNAASVRANVASIDGYRLRVVVLPPA